MLEDSAHNIDVLMAIGQSSVNTSPTAGGEQYRGYLANLSKIATLHTNADELEDEADFFDSLVIWNSLNEDVDEDDDNIHALRQQAAEARRKAEEQVSIST